MTTIVGPTLPEPHYSTVESVWEDLADEFGISTVNPYPHFTLYGLDDADLDAVEVRVREVAARHDPFSVRTDGIGVFPGNHVYIPVAMSDELAALHRDVVEAVAPLGTAPTPFYEPDRWFPHVGLAIRVDDEQVGDVVSFLVEEDFGWEFQVDNVAITRPPSGATEHELVTTIDL